ncbi:hypothetical protein HN51_053621 [Arachis hypogaea]|nr:hypothetical protein Ahy_B09g095033 isoform B [Arachis hypogaea]
MANAIGKGHHSWYANFVPAIAFLAAKTQKESIVGLNISYKIGEGGIALAEAVHGSAPDIAGKNLANPTALLLSCVSILRHLNLHDKADQIQNAILNTIAEGKYRTADLGGKARTTEFTNAIIDHL